MSDNSVKPEDLIPDGVDSILLGGKTIRKGTVAAFLANLDILENPLSTEKQKQDAQNQMRELAPAIIITGLHRHVVFKNAEVEDMLAETAISG